MTPANGQSDLVQATLNYTMLIGATGGIGQEIARQLCANNQPVILVGRNNRP